MFTVWGFFFPLDTASTHLWPKLAPTEHKGLCWFSGLVPTQGLASANYLCQLGNERSHVFLPSRFPLSRGGQWGEPLQGDSWSKRCLQLQLLQPGFLSELINRSLCTARSLIWHKSFQVTSKPGNKTNFPPPKQFQQQPKPSLHAAKHSCTLIRNWYTISKPNFQKVDGTFMHTLLWPSL